MSRRGRHGRHGHPGAPRPAQTTGASAPEHGSAPEHAPGTVDARTVDARTVDSRAVDARPVDEGPAAPVDLASTRPVPAPTHLAHSTNGNGVHREAVAAAPVPAAVGAPIAPEAPGHGFSAEGSRTTCTTAQLRRFIKSRPWVPMHELRRRFGIWGADDDVTPIRVGDQTLFIGLPDAEGRMVAELLSGGDVGYELSLDPGAPIVVGVYPMRPVPRS